MKRILPFLFAVVLVTLGSCEKFKTDAVTGREFLLRQGPRTQHFGPGVTEFTGENGMFIAASGPYFSLESGDEITGDPEFWLVEFVDEKAMMLAGIPTVSNGQILSTAGAFKLTTRINGEIVRPAYLSFGVPSESNNPNMEVFFGALTWDDQFDWRLDTGGIVSPELSFVDTTGFSGPSGYQGWVNPLQNYFFEDGSMYINCDYFPSWGIPLTNIVVRPSSESSFTPVQNSVSLMFDTLNVYMNGYWIPQNNGYGFTNVPIGFDVTCLAVGVDNNQELYFGMLDFEIEENGVYTFVMEPVTEEELEDILDGL